MVASIRADTGTCTYTDLQAASKLTRGTLQRRVQRLKDSGRLLATSRPGSMRVPEAHPMELELVGSD